MGKRLKFVMSEKLQTIQEDLAVNVLPHLELEWEEKRVFDESTQTENRIFETSIGCHKITVKENGITFVTRNHQDSEGVFEQTRLLEQTLPNGQKTKSLMHKTLCERFDKSDDVLFYRGLTESLREHVVVDESKRKEYNKNNAAQQKLHL